MSQVFWGLSNHTYSLLGLGFRPKEVADNPVAERDVKDRPVDVGEIWLPVSRYETFVANILESGVTACLYEYCWR